MVAGALPRLELLMRVRTLRDGVHAGDSVNIAFWFAKRESVRAWG